jgi:Tol biopolymer transport system component
MELVTGQSLEDRLEAGALEPRLAALIARGIAHALGAAHDAGLVHRDVKPSNILLDPQDEPMLTDFGLVHDQSASRLTISASVLGTPAYMSAEQARGEAPRPEHDIYSLGAVLFAMLAGRAPYLGELPSAVLSQVLTLQPPPLPVLRPDVPRPLVAICEKAMSRNVRGRYRTCQEFVCEIDRYLEGTRTEAERSVAREARHRWARWFLLGAGIVGAVAIGGWLIVSDRRSGEGRGGARLADGPRAMRRITGTPGLELEPSLSPTAEWFAYASPRDGDFDIYVDRTGEQRPENVTPDWEGMDVQPSVSPDGRAIAFRSDRSGGGVFVLDVGSRAVRRVAEFGYHPAWSPDGKTIAVSTELVYGVGRSPRNTQSEIWTIDMSSGKQERLVSADAVQPAWSPGGSRLAFWGKRGDVTGLWTVGRTGQDVVPCSVGTESVRDPVWLPSGDALLVTTRASEASTIQAIAIDEKTGECSREHVPLTRSLAGAQQSGAVSRDGRYLALVSWERGESAVRIGSNAGSLAAPVPVTGDTRVESAPDLSPDGQWIALSVQDGPADLVVVRTDNSVRRGLTEDSFEERTPRWSPDGEWIAFAANRTGHFEIWRIRPDGSGAERLTETAGGSALSPVWSPDGRRLAYGVRGKGILEIDPTIPAPRTPRVLFPADRLGDQDAVPRAWSPDGRHLLLVGRDGNSSLLDLQTAQEARLSSRAHGGAWASPHELWITDGGELKALDTASDKSRVLLSVAPRRFSASLSIDRRTGDAYTTVVENEADIWLADLKGAEPEAASATEGR